MKNLKLGDWGDTLGALTYVPGSAPPVGTVSTATFDGETHGTVILPDGNEWFSENLKTDEYGIYYANNPTYAAYGKLFTGAEFVTISGLLTDGWRIPTYEETTPFTMFGPETSWLRILEKEYWDPAGPWYSLYGDDFGFKLRANGGGKFFNGWFFITQWASFGWLSADKQYWGKTEVRDNDARWFHDPAQYPATPEYDWYTPLRLVRTPIPGNPSISVPAFRVLLHDNPFFQGYPTLFNIPAQQVILPIGDLAPSYLCAQRIGDTVSLVLIPATDAATINMSNLAYVWRVEVIGTTLFQSPVSSDAIPQGQHDILLESGNAVTEANLAQRIDCSLRTFLGEHWLNPAEGMPYFQEFLRKNPDISVCKQAFASLIQSVPGVSSLDRLDVNFSNSSRSFRVDFDVTGTDTVPVSSTSEVAV